MMSKHSAKPVTHCVVIRLGDSAELFAQGQRRQLVVVDGCALGRGDDGGEDVFAVAVDVDFQQAAAFHDREHGRGPGAAVL
jgi:hypothetical protein